MSTNRNVANLSIAFVKTLVKMAGFGFAADMIDGAQECLNLLADLKNDTLGNPNAEMIRRLNGAVKSELDAIEGALTQNGMSRKQIEQALAQLSDAARETIKALAEDDDALIRAVQQPQCFAEQLRGHAAPIPDYSSDEMQAHYETLLDRIAEEFLTLAPWSPNFNRAALTSLLHCFPALTERIDRLEQQINEGFNSVREDAAAHHQDLKNDLASLHEDLRNNRPTKLEDEVWGSRPARQAHWVERHPTSMGTTLQDVIFSSPSSQSGSRSVLAGRAGSGKTSIAASIASRCESDKWSFVAWIDASSRSNIEGELIALGESVLGIQTDIKQEQRLKVQQVLATLRHFGKNRCLFVYDNVEGVDDLNGVLPDGSGVHIIVTTQRKSGWPNQNDWSIFTIGNFSRDESVKLLISVTKDSDRETADKLASDLGDLPLAVAQAAATCSRYYANLQGYYTDLKATNIEELLEPIEGGHYSKGAIASLQLATHSALNFMKDPLVKKEAEGILAVLCYLAESGVPTKWLKYNNGLPSRKAFKLLQDASIIDQSNDGRITSIHRLLAHALRESWREEEREQACESAATLLGSVDIDRLPSDDSDARFQETRNLIEHLRAFGAQDCFHCLEDYRHIMNALCQAFDHARDLGLVPEVFALKELVDTLRKQVGDSREILSLLAKLAYAHMYMGEYPAAISLYEHILSAREQIQEPNHRDILSTRNDLAYAYYWVDRTDEAINLFEQVLDERTRILISDHEDTLMTGSYLALAYADDGQLERAIALGEQVVKDRDRVLKPDHKHTLVTRNNLADAYKSAGRLTDAIKMYEYVLEARIRTLGSTHHHTRITRNDLAQTYEQAGDLPKAISMYEDLHNDYIRIYGADHEKTIEVRDRLEAAKRKLEQQEEKSPAE